MDGGSYAQAWIAGRNALLIIVTIVFIFIGALLHRLDVQRGKEWVADCIISHVDLRPPQGLRTYCEELYAANK